MITNRIAVVGLDVGNGASHVGLARGAKIEVLQSKSGKRKCPSTVAFTSRKRVYGAEAVSQQRSNAKNTINDLVQFIGLTADDPDFATITQNRAFTVRPAPPEFDLRSRKRVCYSVRLKGQEYDVLPETALAYLLNQLKTIVQQETKGQNVEDCVIAVPGYWGDRERRSIQTSLKLAGLVPLRLMNENCALALYYGLRQAMPEQPINVLFIDCGKTHTSMSLVELKAGELRVKAAQHDATLGGRSFDQVVYDYLAADILKKFRLDVKDNAKARLKLLAEAEKVKILLSANRETRYNVEYLMNDTDVKGTMTRADFDALCEPLFARAAALSAKILSTAGVDAKDLHSIEIVGGCSRVPGLKDRLTSALGKNLSTTCDSDEGVVRGTTLECAHLSSSTRLAKTFKAVDINNHPISIVWTTASGEEKSLTVFKPGDKLPCMVKIPFKRQEAFTLKLRYDRAMMAAEDYKGQSLSTAVDDHLATFRIDGKFAELLEQYPQDRVPKVTVKVSLDKNGLVFVKEADIALRYEKVIEEKTAPVIPGQAGVAAPTTEKKEEKKKSKTKIKSVSLEVTAEFNNGFTPAQEDLMRSQLAAMAMVDADAVARDQAYNNLESFILEAGQDLDRDLSTYLTATSKEAFENQLRAGEDWMYDAYDAETGAFEEKLTELKNADDGAYGRRQNYRLVESQLESVATSARQYSAAANLPKYAHLSAEDHEVIATEAKALTTLASEVESKLSSADRTAAPVLTAESIATALAAARGKVDPLLRKKATEEQAKAAEDAAKTAEEEAAEAGPRLQIEG